MLSTQPVKTTFRIWSLYSFFLFGPCFAPSIEIGGKFSTYDKFLFSVGIVSVQKVKLLWDKTFSHQLNFGSKKSLPNAGKKWMYFWKWGGEG
jgi:hypothetical protein